MFSDQSGLVFFFVTRRAEKEPAKVAGSETQHSGEVQETTGSHRTVSSRTCEQIKKTTYEGKLTITNVSLLLSSCTCPPHNVSLLD